MMGLIKTTLRALGLLALSACSQSEYQKHHFEQNIEPHLATKRPYINPAALTSPPDQCQLIHINHLGRHGSRYLATRNIATESFVMPAIELGLLIPNDTGHHKAASTSTLTPAGIRFAHLILQLRDRYYSESSPAGEITNQGQEELAGIAQRLIEGSGLSREAFLNQIQKRSLHAGSTSIHRTQTSRTAFLNGMAQALNTDTELNIHYHTPHKGELNTELQFYKYCRNSVHQWKSVIQDHKTEINSALSDVSAQQKLADFSQFFVIDPTFNKQKDFSKLAYQICMLDANQGYQLGACDLISQAPEYQAVFELHGHITNLRQFYGRGPALEYRGLNGDMAIDLLNNFMDTTTASIEHQNAPFAHLRFAHESTILRMLQILDLVTYENSTDDQGHITWDVSRLSPMAANIIWQTFQCSFEGQAPSYQTRMLVNEHITPFPIDTCQNKNGLCDWSTVANHYKNKFRTMTLEKACGAVDINLQNFHGDDE